MKRLFLIPFLLVYLLSVSGVPVYAHYCGGNLESWEIFMPNESGCEEDGCEQEMPGIAEEGCCQDKIIAVAPVTEQVIRDTKITFSNFIPEAADALETQLWLPEIPRPALRIFSPVLKANAPPGRWQNQPLYKLFVRFTLYG